MTKNIALVLSGGGARGVAHIGVIEVLNEKGFNITSIAGTSMGALVGGVYALGKMAEFKEWLLTIDRFKVFQLVDFRFSPQGLVKGDKVLDEMKSFIQDSNIEDLPIPYSATAVDINGRKEYVFKKGSVFDAIRASISIPSVFTPVKKGKMLLVDGGVMNNIPLSNVTRTRSDQLVAVNVNANIPVLKLRSSKETKESRLVKYQEKLNHYYEQLQRLYPKETKEKHIGYFSLIDLTISLMMYQNAIFALKDIPPDILINISRDTCSTFDFYKSDELIEIGRVTAEKVLKDRFLVD